MPRDSAEQAADQSGTRNHFNMCYLTVELHLFHVG